MKLPLLILTTATVGAAPLCAQERAESFDAQAAKATLSGNVKKAPSKFLTKGVDPVTSRFYTKDAVIVTRSSGAKEEHPYVAVPLLFQKNSDELLDGISRENVAKVAQMLKEIGSGAFAIEGHASAEGDAQHNTELSNLRAAKIQVLLRDAGVPEAELGRVQGFGAQFAQAAPAAPEAQRQQDRRVLVVRER